jgi:hypothetical protein
LFFGLLFDITDCDVKQRGARMESCAVVSVDVVALAIIDLRGQRVLLDSVLAGLYEVETRSLIQAVQRNVDRFPDDFMFQLSTEEWTALRPRDGQGRGGRRTPPYAFTQEGVAMLSSVLRSGRAVAVNIQIMRAFVRMRQMLRSQADLAWRLDELEAKYDSQFSIVFDAIRQLMTPPAPPRHSIGFVQPGDA